MCLRLFVYLRVHQCVIEQNEPVVGEAPGVLQSQRPVAAFADHTALRESQNLLQGHSLVERERKKKTRRGRKKTLSHKSCLDQQSSQARQAWLVRFSSETVLCSQWFFQSGSSRRGRCSQTPSPSSAGTKRGSHTGCSPDGGTDTLALTGEDKRVVF